MVKRAFLTLVLIGNVFFVGFDLASGKPFEWSLLAAASCGLMLILCGGDK